MVGVISGLLVAGAILSGFHWATYRGWIDPSSLRMLAAKNHLDQPAIYLGFACWTSTVNALLEEYVWRWFVVRRWEDVLGASSRPALRVPAALLAAACFTIHHVVVLALYFDIQAVLLGTVGVFAGAAVWSGLYVKYRSIWPGFLSHVLADAAIFWVGWKLIAA